MTDRELSFMLASLAGQVRRLAPSHRDPERFHADKSEIEATLRRLSRLTGPSGPMRIAGARHPENSPYNKIRQGGA